MSPLLYEGGPAVKIGAVVKGRELTVTDEQRSFLYRLLCGGQGGWEVRSGGAIPTGLSGSHGGCGACRGEGLLAGEHVPDRLCQPPGDVDLGDLGAALFAEAALGALVALGVGRVPAGMGCRLDQGPA